MRNHEKTDFAVVVGINKYRHPSYKSLRGAVNDARDFVEWLESTAGGQVAIWPHYSDRDGRAPRKDEIERSFDELLQPCETGEARLGRRLYIFLAGHGVSDEPDNACLLTADHTATKNSLLPARAVADFFRKTALFDEIVLFVDACRHCVENLTVPPIPWTIPADPDGMSQVKHCYAFGATPYGKSFEKPYGSRYRGVFSWALMQGLRGKAADANGIITAESLARYIARRFKGQTAPDFHPRYPEMVFGQTEPPLTEVVVELTEPQAPLRVEDGKNGDRLDVELERLAEDRIRFWLPPWKLYVIGIPDSEEGLRKYQIINLEDETFDVRL